MINRIVKARTFIRKLNGGSQSLLVEADDNNLYVVKFLNNPQGRDVLFNEAMGLQIASEVGLKVPDWSIIDVESTFLSSIGEVIEGSGESYESGLQLGIKLVVHPARGRVLDPVSPLMYMQVTNPQEVAAAAFFDTWTCNTDRRQMVCWRETQKKHYHLSCIDFGHCFGGPEHYWGATPLELLSYHQKHGMFADIRKTQVPSEILRWECSGVSRIASYLPQTWIPASPSIGNIGYHLFERKEIIKQLFFLLGKERRSGARWVRTIAMDGSARLASQ